MESRASRWKGRVVRSIESRWAADWMRVGREGWDVEVDMLNSRRKIVVEKRE
jgi:hypothetical protein